MLEIGICIDTTAKEKEYAFDNLLLIVGFKRLIMDTDMKKMLNAIYRFAVTFSNPPQRGKYSSALNNETNVSCLNFLLLTWS
jgi:hypothetical protein